MTDNATFDGDAHPAVVALVYVNQAGDGLFDVLQRNAHRTDGGLDGEPLQRRHC